VIGDKEMDRKRELAGLKKILQKHREGGKILIAMLYGSFAGGTPHSRSDIDLGLYLNTGSEDEELDVIDEILMSTERQVSILRLDDDEESPLVVQEALKGIQLVEPDEVTLYRLYGRILHECEEIRFRRELKSGSHT